MKFQVNYSYEELINIINNEPQDKTIPRDEFLERFEERRRDKLLSKAEKDKQRTALNLFRAYSQGMIDIHLNNQSLFEFYLWYKNEACSELLKYGHNMCTATIRSFMLELDNSLALLPIKTVKKALKLCSYSRLTQSCIIYYEKNGRYLTSDVMHIEKDDGSIQVKKQFKRTDRQLASRSIYDRLKCFTSFMERLKLKCIEEVTAEILENYLRENLYTAAVRKLYMGLESFFGNLKDARMIKVNPFSSIEYEKPRSKINNDMLHPDDIKKLQEMALGLEKLPIIQARTLVFLMLCYDTGMRLNEALLVDTSDFTFDGENITLTLAGENQKGQQKISRFLLMYFPETRYIIRTYLEKVRPKFKPVSEAFFLNNRGGRVQQQMINKGIHSLMKSLNMKTFNGKAVTSHIMRHSFASHNIEPLGLKLSLDQIISRLRHKDRTLAEKVYILDNPFIEIMKHQERQQGLRSNSTNQFWMIEKSIFMAWMKNELKLPRKLLIQLDEYYEDRLSAKDSQKDRIESLPTMPEDEAIKLLSKFKFTKNALRKYCSEKNYCRKFGKEFKYDENFIWMLRDEYIPKDEALRKLKITRATLFRQKKLLELITIGRTIIVQKSGLIKYLGNRGTPKL